MTRRKKPIIKLRARSRPQRIRSLFLAISGIGFLSLIVFWSLLGQYALPRYVYQSSYSTGTLLVSGSQYLSPNEDEKIRFALHNNLLRIVHVGLKLEVHHSAPVFFEQGGTNIIFAGAIQEAEQVERIVNIFIPYDTVQRPNAVLNTPIDIVALYTLEGSPSERFILPSFYIAPIPWTHTLFTGVSTLLAALISWICSLANFHPAITRCETSPLQQQFVIECSDELRRLFKRSLAPTAPATVRVATEFDPANWETLGTLRLPA